MDSNLFRSFFLSAPQRRPVTPLISLETLENRKLLTGALYPLPAATDDFTGTWIDPGDYQFDLEQQGNKVTGRIHFLPLGGFSDDIKGKANENDLSMTLKFPVTISSPDGTLKYKVKGSLNVERTGNTFSGLLKFSSKKGGVDTTILIDASRM